MDLADFVSEQGELAGRNAVAHLTGEEMETWDESRTTSMLKGYPVPDTVTCTLCPNGCQVRRVADENGTFTYEGNKCPRGIDFAEQERTAPRRMLTTTVRDADGHLIPVRTGQPISREKMFDAMKEMRTFTADCTENIRCGDTLTYVTDKDGSRIRVIATADSR